MLGKLDARARRSQKALLRSGLELLNTNPEAALSDIAAHAGVGRTTLYRQYETREKLIVAIAVHCLETMDEVTAPVEKEAKTALDAIRLLFELAMPLTEELQFLLNLDQLVEDDPVVTKLYEKQKKELAEVVEFGKKKGEINKSLSTSWVINLIDGLFYIGWMQMKQEKCSPGVVAKLAFTSFSLGVSARK